MNAKTKARVARSEGGIRRGRPAVVMEVTYLTWTADKPAQQVVRNLFDPQTVVRL